MALKKSALYSSYNYAFKFVNRVVQDLGNYHYSTDNAIVFGTINDDIGDIVNDFAYERGSFDFGTDYGHSHAYGARFDVEDARIPCVVVTHETSLEVFLIAAGAFIGTEVAKYGIKRCVEEIEKKINAWWDNSDKKIPRPQPLQGESVCFRLFLKGLCCHHPPIMGMACHL